LGIIELIVDARQELIQKIPQVSNAKALTSLAQVILESSFRRRAVSDKGAIGLLQIMPATALERLNCFLSVGQEVKYAYNGQLRTLTPEKLASLTRDSHELKAILKDYKVNAQLSMAYMAHLKTTVFESQNSDSRYEVNIPTDSLVFALAYYIGGETGPLNYQKVINGQERAGDITNYINSVLQIMDQFENMLPW